MPGFLDSMHARQNRAINNMATRANNNPEMEGPMCCMCIPMRYGIILIGIYMFFDVSQTTKTAGQMRDISPLVFGFFVAALIPAMIAVYIFIKYFCC